MYVMVRPKLILKLELLLADVNNELGIAADHFHVMSGYRTPFYNHAIKNVAYLRHVWGGAADIFIDMKAPAGRMDDLNGDGVVDKADAKLLFDLATSLPARHQRPELEGGGVYLRANRLAGALCACGCARHAGTLGAIAPRLSHPKTGL